MDTPADQIRVSTLAPLKRKKWRPRQRRRPRPDAPPAWVASFPTPPVRAALALCSSLQLATDTSCLIGPWLLSHLLSARLLGRNKGSLLWVSWMLMCRFPSRLWGLLKGGNSAPTTPTPFDLIFGTPQDGSSTEGQTASRCDARI
jgi:hypothetical protein